MKTELIKPDQLTGLNKKEIKNLAIETVNELVNDGETNLNKLIAKAAPLCEFLKEFIDKVKPELEQVNSYGVNVTQRNGAKMIQYTDDAKYNELKEKLKAREELLKAALASKDVIFDNEGDEVPKVSIKYKKDSIIIEL